MRRAIEVLHDLLIGVFLATLALTWAIGSGKDAFAGEGSCCNANREGCPTNGCEYDKADCPYCNDCCLV